VAAVEVPEAVLVPAAVQDLVQALVQVAVQDLAIVQVAVLTEIQVAAEGLQATEIRLRMLPLVPHHQ
jgi:hypothetical protein